MLDKLLDKVFDFAVSPRGIVTLLSALGATLAGVSDTYTVAVRALTGTHSAIGTMAFWDLT